MGEYVDGKWRPTFGDVQAGVSDWAPGEGSFPKNVGAENEIKRLEKALQAASTEHADLIKYAEQFIGHEDAVKFKTDGAWHTFHIFKDALERASGKRGQNELL